jgi:S-formylglutathione hydrolase FrmB
MPRLSLFCLCLCLATATVAQAQTSWVKAPAQADLKNIPGLKHFVFESTSMKVRVGYNVVLPQAYTRDPNRRFPVVYWLHGGGGNESSSLFTAKAWTDLIQAKEIDPVILVYPSGFRSGYMDHADGKVMVESMIIRELIPRIDREYRTIAKRTGRAVHGFSMGSSGALKFAIKYPDLFCAAMGAGGGAINLEETKDPWLLNILERNLNSDPKLIQQNNTYHFLAKNHETVVRNGTRFLLLCGDRDVWLKSAETFQSALLEKDIPCELIKVPGVAHSLRGVFRAEDKRSARFQDAAFKAAKPISDILGSHVN